MAAKILPSSLRALARSSGSRNAFFQRISSAPPSRTIRAAAPFSGPTTTGTTSRRFAHTIPRPAAANASDAAPKVAAQTDAPPSYELTFTCIPCGERSAHRVSKQGYHHGSVLITCPSCRNRHVISDHMGIFGKDKKTVEDLLREKGVLVKRGTLGEDGDVEFWEDGTTTSRSERQGDGDGQDPKPKPKGTNKAEPNPDAPGSTFGQA